MGMAVSYCDEKQLLEGYLAAPDSGHPLPGVLLVPSWLNVNESICRRADRLAAAGYLGFVVDLFGAGVRPRPPQPPLEVVGPFLRDRIQFRRRLFAGLSALHRRPECDSHRIAAVGYCVGGCGALELARAGAPLRGVVSLHGILSAPIPAAPNTVVSKILVLHGDADPLATFDQLATFRDEMRTAQANWELDIYGGARHSFTGEGVLDQNSPEAGLHPQSESRSWRATLEFLAEVLQRPPS
jgi:dienelactone hydrolase